MSQTLAADISHQYEKMIWIDQLKQVGSAYENGKKVMEFPVLTGDDETTTDPGIYLVRVKQVDYYCVWRLKNAEGGGRIVRHLLHR